MKNLFCFAFFTLCSLLNATPPEPYFLATIPAEHYCFDEAHNRLFFIDHEAKNVKTLDLLTGTIAEKVVLEGRRPKRIAIDASGRYISLLYEKNIYIIDLQDESKIVFTFRAPKEERLKIVIFSQIHEKFFILTNKKIRAVNLVSFNEEEELPKELQFNEKVNLERSYIPIPPGSHWNPSDYQNRFSIDEALIHQSKEYKFLQFMVKEGLQDELSLPSFLHILYGKSAFSFSHRINGLFEVKASEEHKRFFIKKMNAAFSPKKRFIVSQSKIYPPSLDIFSLDAFSLEHRALEKLFYQHFPREPQLEKRDSPGDEELSRSLFYRLYFHKDEKFIKYFNKNKKELFETFFSQKERINTNGLAKLVDYHLYGNFSNEISDMIAESYQDLQEEDKKYFKKFIVWLRYKYIYDMDREDNLFERLAIISFNDLIDTISDDIVWTAFLEEMKKISLLSAIGGLVGQENLDNSELHRHLKEIRFEKILRFQLDKFLKNYADEIFETLSLGEKEKKFIEALLLRTRNEYLFQWPSKPLEMYLDEDWNALLDVPIIYPQPPSYGIYQLFSTKEKIVLKI